MNAGYQEAEKDTEMIKISKMKITAFETCRAGNNQKLAGNCQESINEGCSF